MKNVLTVCLMCLFCSAMNSQKTVEKNIDYEGQKINFELKFATDIEVNTWDKPYVYVKANVNTKEGKYLNFYNLEITEGDEEITVTSKAEEIFKKFWEERRKNNVKDDVKVKHDDNDMDGKEFNYVIYVPSESNFKINSISGNLKSEIIKGDFTAKLINGNIDIDKYTGKLSLSTVNGAIDLKVVKANLIVETLHGNIYSDDNLELIASNQKKMGQKMKSVTSGATNKLHLNTVNGDMYLRL